jgi:hypothetical protein
VHFIGNILSCLLSLGCLVISAKMLKYSKWAIWLVVASSVGLLLRILLNVEDLTGLDFLYDTSYVSVFYILLFIAYLTMYMVFKKYLK